MADEKFHLRLTNSEASTWRRCKRKWMLGTYRRLSVPHRDFNRPLTIGDRLHKALAEYYVPDSAGPVDPIEWLKQSITTDLEKYPEAETDLMKEQDLLVTMMEGYLQWCGEEGEDSDLEVIASEAEMEVPFFETDDAVVTLLSKIDARVRRRSNGLVLALEHKSVGDLKSPLVMLQIDTQLLTEHLVELLHQQSTGEQAQTADGVLYNMLRKVKRSSRAKPPFYGREEVRHNLDELRSHYHHMYAVANEILDARRKLAAGESHQTIAYPTPIGRNCDWSCDFFNVCPMHDDGSDVESVLAANYITKDPLERYASTGGAA